MPEIDWDITPGRVGISRISRLGGRREAKEWNLIGASVDAAAAERYDLANRVCAPEALDDEVRALTEVMLRMHPLTLRRTKCALNKSADMSVHHALSIEVPIQPFAADGKGIRDFASKNGRERRRRAVAQLLAKLDDTRGLTGGDDPRNGLLRSERLQRAVELFRFRAPRTRPAQPGSEQ